MAEGAKIIANLLETNTTLTSVGYAAGRLSPYCQHPLTLSARNDQTTRKDQARIANQKNVIETRFFRDFEAFIEGEKEEKEKKKTLDLQLQNS